MYTSFRPLALALAFSIAAPASALWVPGWEKVDPIIVSGTATGGYLWDKASFMITSPGSYRLSWKLDRPLGFMSDESPEIVVIHAWHGWVIDTYMGGEPVNVGGEEVDAQFMVQSSGQMMLHVPKPLILGDDSNGYQAVDWEYLSLIGIEAETAIGVPLRYRLTLAQVPEPASWAMMIAGFGLVGGALRRKGEALSA